MTLTLVRAVGNDLLGSTWPSPLLSAPCLGLPPGLRSWRS